MPNEAVATTAPTPQAPPLDAATKALLLKAVRRLLLNGPPLTGKSTGFLTLPGPRHVLVAPWENGFSSILAYPDTTVHFREFDPTSSQIMWAKELAWFETRRGEILAGKHGPVTSFCIDGLHCLYTAVMYAEGWLPTDVDSKDKAKNYVKYHERFKRLLNPIITSGIPYVAASVYDGAENPNAVGSATSEEMVVMPRLPGQMAKDIMGMFPVVFHTERRVAPPPAGYSYHWRLKPMGKVQGAGLHLPAHIAAQMPSEMTVRLEGARLVGGWQEFEARVNEVLG